MSNPLLQTGKNETICHKHFFHRIPYINNDQSIQIRIAGV